MWTEDNIRSELATFRDRNLALRWGKVLDWVLTKKIFLEHNEKWPNIRVKGRGEFHIATFMAGTRHKADGNLYLFAEKERYAQDSGLDELKELRVELAKIRLRLRNPNNKNGSYLTRKITQLSEHEFQELLKILDKYTR